MRRRAVCWSQRAGGSRQKGRVGQQARGNEKRVVAGLQAMWVAQQRTAAFSLMPDPSPLPIARCLLTLIHRKILMSPAG